MKAGMHGLTLTWPSKSFIAYAATLVSTSLLHLEGRF